MENDLGLPGFEPGLVDSESTVLAITPQALFFVSYLKSHDTLHQNIFYKM